MSVAPENIVPGVRRLAGADWKSLWLVVFIAFVNAISFQGSRGLYETTEGRYAECARETMLSGDLDDPILNNNPHWTKPPLTYLAIMAGVRTFGDSPWGVRAYLVVAMVLAAAAVWWAGMSIWGPGAGRWAGVVFATSPAVAAFANSVSTDMLVTLWAALAIAAFWHGRARNSRWAALLAWIFAGLGGLTKGPPALLVPAASLGCAGLLLRRAKSWQPGVWTALAGAALFLVVGFGWYVSESIEFPGLASYWLGQEIVARNLTAEFHRNPGFHFVFTVYIPLLLLGTGPWLWLVWHRWRQSSNRFPLSRPSPWTWNDGARWSLIAGVALPFVIFSLSRSRLAYYLAPLFVPLSLLLGRSLDALIAQGQLQRRTAAGIAGGLLLLIVAVKGLAGMRETTYDMTHLAAHLAPVLGRVQPAAIYSVGRRQLNGLEFHLRRDVEPIEQDVFERQLCAQGQPGARAFYLIKKKNWVRMATNVVAAIQVEPIGPRWIGVWPADAPSRSELP